MNKIKLAVLMGGIGCEREVSLVSGRGVVENLDKEKYEVWAVDVPRELEKVVGCDVAFLALHGRGGEDGTIQGYLETLGIKYTGCGVLASAIGMDKVYFKWVMRENGIEVPKDGKGLPCVVKPVRGGSSVGVSIVEKEGQMDKAIKLAKEIDERIMFEEYIRGTEVTCGVWGPSASSGLMEALPVVEIVPKNKFFDYEAKYIQGKAEEICPGRFSDVLTRKVQETAIKVFRAIDGRGYARVDMIVKGDEPVVLDINTLPGLTPNSLFPKEAKALGLSYGQMLDRMIELAREE